MDRRDSIKTILLGTFAGTTFAYAGCKYQPHPLPESTPLPDYGRTPEEKKIDEQLMSETFFTAYEMSTIRRLCDIILPAEKELVSATQAGVPEFIEFIVKDIPRHQLPLRGGLMWLDAEANKKYENSFVNCSEKDQLQLIDRIAYEDKAQPEDLPGVKFFNLMRDLTLTGFYTSREGINELGYQGNRANIWDGVPDEVLKKHGLEYEPEWIAKCIDQEEREEIAKWDENGNLI